jgi:hypothetical protein
MFGLRRAATIIGEGLKVVGNVTADGSVEIYGRLDGEVQCKSLLLSRNAHLVGAVTAEHATINGTVEGPIHAGHVTLKSRAHVVGDIHHQSRPSRRARISRAGRCKRPSRKPPCPRRPGRSSGPCPLTPTARPSPRPPPRPVREARKSLD